MSNKPSQSASQITLIELIASAWLGIAGLSTGVSVLIVGMILSSLLNVGGKPGASNFFFNVASWGGGGLSVLSLAGLGVQGRRTYLALTSVTSVTAVTADEQDQEEEKEV